MGISLSGLTSSSTGDLTVHSAAGSTILMGDAATLLSLDGSLGTGQIGILGIANSNNAIYIAPAATTAAANNTWNWMQLGGGSGVTVPSGTSSHVATLNLEEPNITATGTVTVGATLRIVSAPTEGTNNYSLWVDDGAVRFDDRTFSIGGIAYEFPANNGDASQYLQTDGSGNLSWAAAEGVATGSGTGVKIPKWTSSSAQGDSVITEVSGNIGINDTTPGVNFGGGTHDYVGAVEIAPSGNRSALLLSGTTDSQVVFGDSGQSSGTRKAALGFYAGKLSMYFVADANTGRSGNAGTHLMQNGNFGIGTDAPDRLLHIYAGDSAATPRSEAILVVEENDDVEIQLMSPNNKSTGISFGDPQNNIAGMIQYQHANERMSFHVGAAERLRFTSSSFDFLQATTLTTAAGNLTISAATGADVLIGDNATIL